jgi:hypothetical protein
MTVSIARFCLEARLTKPKRFSVYRQQLALFSDAVYVDADCIIMETCTQAASTYVRT